MNTLFTKLPKTNFSGLEYQNIIEDIIQIVKENPEYNQQYDDFLSSNAGRMLIEMFAYITDQLATRIDWVVNENFLSTATQKNSVIKILKLVGYIFNLPSASKVTVSADIDKKVDGKVYLGKGFYEENETNRLDIFYLTAEDKNGLKRTFEYLLPKTLGNGDIYDYLNPPEFSNNMTLVEGKTFFQEEIIITDNNQKIPLGKGPVINNSIRVYTEDASEAIEVDSFLDPVSHQIVAEKSIQDITYKKNVEANDMVVIEFPPSSIVSNIKKRPKVGDKIRIFYRVGGGRNGNIVANAINTTKRVTLYNESGDQLEGSFSISFKNNTAGGGGEESESVENAIMQAPLAIQTAKKTVTEEDYNYVIGQRPDVLKSKSFGNSNVNLILETAYTNYGSYINPMDVWNFVLLNKQGWETLLPSQYNDFQWFETRLENRFNEIQSFKDGSINFAVSKKQIEVIKGEGEYNNFVVLETPEKFKGEVDGTPYIETEQFKCKLTESPINSYFFNDIKFSNEFDENFTTNGGMLDKDTHSIVEKTQPILFSQRNIFYKVDTSIQNELKINIDNRGTITIELENDLLTATEIASSINDAFKTSALYNDSEDSIEDAYQEININNDGTGDSGLAPSTVYSFSINGREYSFKTGTGTTTYNQLIVLMENASFFTLYGRTTKNSLSVEDINFGIRRVKKGMKVEIKGVPLEISEVFTMSNSILLTSSNFITESDVSIKILPYDFSIESNKIRITNLGDIPLNSVIIEKGRIGIDLLAALNKPLEEPSKNIGLPFGSHSITNVIADNLLASTEYSIKVNRRIYTITTAEALGLSDIVGLLNTEMAPNYSCSLTGDTLIFANKANSYIEIEGVESHELVGTAKNLIEELDGDIGQAIGAGSYLNVAKAVVNGSTSFIQIESPSRGSAAKIEIDVSGALNASNRVFGFADNLSVLGEKKLTINEDSNLVYENNFFYFIENKKNFYIQFLIDDKKSIPIGKYFLDNFSETDTNYRGKADRVYNTSYNELTKKIDYFNSNFIVKFTKEKIKNLSLLTINNSWDLKQATFPEVSTVDNPNTVDFTDKYEIKITIDNNDHKIIDVTGDKGIKGSNYLLEDISNAINNNLQLALYEFPSYKFFSYTKIEGEKIIIRSPNNNNESYILIESGTKDGSSSCFSDLFDTPAVSTPSGDYFLFFDEEKKEMNLKKLEGTEGNPNVSNMPDFPFYFHFIFDKRVYDGIYDGEDGRPGVKKNTLDEDNLLNYLNNYKIVGVNNVFKIPKFTTFDIACSIEYNKFFSREDVRKKIEKIIVDNFKLESMEFGMSVYKSKISSLIQGVLGVENVSIDYFGHDYENNGQNYDSFIPVDFNEILVLSENKTIDGKRIKGMIFEYRKSE